MMTRVVKKSAIPAVKTSETFRVCLERIPKVEIQCYCFGGLIANMTEGQKALTLKQLDYLPTAMHHKNPMYFISKFMKSSPVLSCCIGKRLSNQGKFFLQNFLIAGHLSRLWYRP